MPKQEFSPTQEFIQIADVRDGVVILKNGSLRAILMVSSTNFALKSQQEQDALIFQFQNFLNSLDFQIEFAVHSRKLNISPYLKFLQARIPEQKEELLRIQTQEYIEFIKSFTELQNIMSKTFFVVVPFEKIALKQATGAFSELFGTTKKETFNEEEFLHDKEQLWQRVNAVTIGFRQMGLRSLPLGNEELLELFYNLYNPDETAKKLPTITA